MRIKKCWLVLLLLSLLGGCAQTTETIALDESDLPWGRPADWEKTMPIAPGVQY